MTSIVCPLCNKDDVIQKVSAVVASGKTTSKFSGPSGGIANVDGKWGVVSGYTSLSGHTISELATLLAPPPEPKKPSGFGYWWILIGGVVIPVLAFIPMFILVISTILYPSINQSVGLLSPSFIMLPCLGCLSVVSLVILFIWIDNRIKVKSKPKYLAEKLKWDTAMQHWNRLYYCNRHDIVFDPDTNETCMPQDTKKFSYA